MSAAEKIEVQDTTATADLISVRSAPAKISVNFEEVKTKLQSELQKYDLVVTVETLPDAKKLATELNKNAAEFDKRRKEAVAQVSGPIRLFEEQMKELVTMCRNGRQNLLNQVQKFEDETRKKAEEALLEYRYKAWEQKQVDAEFRKAEILDLVKLTALTKTGRLAAATIADLDRRINADKQLQDQTQMRLVMLENQSYKAGLSAPLTRAHVNTFLFADDAVYQQQLDAVIASEIERQKVAEEAVRKRIEQEQENQRRRDEAAQAQAQAQAQIEPEPVADSSPQATFQAPEPVQAPVPQPSPMVASSVIKHAIGPLTRVNEATITDWSRDQAELMALSSSDKEPYGVWSKADGLISIVYMGKIFKEAI